MSHTVTVLDSIADIAQLISDGDIKSAKQHARRALNIADPHALDVLARCVQIIETRPRIAVAKLRQFWRECDGDAAAQAIIYACVPQGARREPENTGSAPKWNTRNRYQAPRNNPTRTDALKRRTRSTREARQVERAAGLVTAYDNELTGANDKDDQHTGPQPQQIRERWELTDVSAERPDGYALDYDRAAVSVLRGTACVSCWVERSVTDHRSQRGTSHDDGLCVDCRERDRAGIPALPLGHTRADAIAARCSHLASQNVGHPATLRVLLRRDWDTLTRPEDRATVALWVKAHPETVNPPATKTHAPLQCLTCGSAPAVRAGQCADCRSLDHATDERAAEPVAA